MKTTIFRTLAVAALSMLASAASAVQTFAGDCALKAFSALNGHMQRQGLMLGMADFAADVQTLIDGPVFGNNPQTRVHSNRVNGRIRVFHSLFRAPAAGTAPAVADRIIWGKLPAGVRILGHLGRLDFNTGTAACTINLGDQFLPARHLAATAINAAGTATPSAAVFTTTTLAATTLGSALLTNVRGLGAYTLGTIVTGTGIPTGTFVIGLDKQARTVLLSAAATATGASVTMTTFGGPFETSDDTSSVANAYASTTDDCTLISVVAGAQVANNQMISLILPYVED